MIRLLLVVFIFLCVCYGIDYSLRIKSLGTDFAYLIPDYETDLILDPNLLGNKLIGISYEPGQNSPLMLSALTRRFGWIGKYWFDHRENRPTTPRQFNTTTIMVDDAWFLDLRGILPGFLADEVWNLQNEGRYDSDRLLDQYGNYIYDYDTTRALKYLLKSSGAYKFGNVFKICVRACDGVYIYDHKYFDSYGPQTEDNNRWLTFFSMRVGLFYTKTSEPNRFTSFYFDVGSPISMAEVDGLPYSIFSRVPINWYDIDLLFFTRNTITSLAWAKSYPLSDRSFVVIGLLDKFVFQRTEIAGSSVYLMGLRNTLSLPVAFERQIGERMTIRAGTRCCYSYNGDRTWNQDSTLIHNNMQNMGISYSFGMQINLSDDGSVILDLLSSNDISSLSNWSVYLKKEW